MHALSRFFAITLASALAATAAGAAPQAISFPLKASDGAAVGSVKASEGPKGVLLHIEVQGLAPGWHGLHFHEKGDCSKSDFTSAGAHVHGEASLIHGLLNPQTNDSGDLPNIFVGADGKGAADVFSPFVSLAGAAGRANLLDSDGSAVVVHANPDDYDSQPIGGAGPRIACGVVAAP